MDESQTFCPVPLSGLNALVLCAWCDRWYSRETGRVVEGPRSKVQESKVLSHGICAGCAEDFTSQISDFKGLDCGAGPVNECQGVFFRREPLAHLLGPADGVMAGPGTPAPDGIAVEFWVETGFEVVVRDCPSAGTEGAGALGVGCKRGAAARESRGPWEVVR